MSEKYASKDKFYVVSESELVDYRRTAINQALTQNYMRFTDADREACKAEAACCARPFEKYQAVVEAAKACASYETGRHELRKALAALEEDV